MFAFIMDDWFIIDTSKCMGVESPLSWLIMMDELADIIGLSGPSYNLPKFDNLINIVTGIHWTVAFVVRRESERERERVNFLNNT